MKKERVTKNKLAIISGGGVLPALLIDDCRKKNRPFVVLALKNHAEPNLLPNDIPINWVRLGAVGKALRLFKNESITDIVMIGSVRRPSLAEIFPDLRGWQMALRIGLKKKGDDGLLRSIINEVERLGLCVHGIQEYLPDLLAPLGNLTITKPDISDIEDISRGCYTAKLLGLADVGQSVIVQQGLVLSVEGIEGTKALIERTKNLKRKGKGGILVKTAKPSQEQRVDLPTIGVHTVQSIFDAGLKGIAIEAGQVLIPNIEEVIAKADSLKIFIIGIQSDELIPPILKKQLDILSGKENSQKPQKKQKRKSIRK